MPQWWRMHVTSAREFLARPVQPEQLDSEIWERAIQDLRDATEASIAEHARAVEVRHDRVTAKNRALILAHEAYLDYLTESDGRDHAVLFTRFYLARKKGAITGAIPQLRSVKKDESP